MACICDGFLQCLSLCFLGGQNVSWQVWWGSEAGNTALSEKVWEKELAIPMLILIMPALCERSHSKPPSLLSVAEEPTETWLVYSSDTGIF